MMRHSMSHVLASAVGKLYKDVKFAIGPAIDNGFYYDFDLPESIKPEDFNKIEQKMREIINSNLDFIRKVISKAEALKLFKNNPYKTELIKDLPEGEDISIYYLGDWVDLCRGPHVENTKFLRGFAFQINRVSGAYWRGSEKNKMLQRVYVYGFDDKQKLKDYLTMMEEALKRDHRKLGKELGLFFISDYAQGMPFYMPCGMIIKEELIKYWREVHKKAGYLEIETPTAMNRSLWEVSGHWGHYKKGMYSFTIEEEDFAIKPMNCPGGMIYYMENMHSYKEFPLRVGELGKVHRHEASGTLHGLFRVRCFTQDDAHIFMLPEQIESEIKGVIDLVDEVYSVFGLTYHLELSTMPEDHIGERAEWEVAEKALENALKKLGKPWKLNPGDGAFYGPKIDIHIKDSIGRTWQCGTIQLDMQMPKRFNLEYTDKDGNKKEPVMIHRVIYGSIDRFMGIITEHFAGAFPLWLAPVQVKIMNIAENSLEYAKEIVALLQAQGFRIELDDRNEKIGKKIRDAQLMKVPYMIVVGEQEKEQKLVAVRGRKSGDLGKMKLEQFIKDIKNENDIKAIF
ncbi:threonine-trna ligase [Holotrichia oblita]|nr:threonine-trna ligase [Holotrichia oblita]